MRVYKLHLVICTGPQIQNPNPCPESKHTLTLDICKHWVVICPSIKSYSTPFCKWPFWPLLMRNMVRLSLEVHTLMFLLYVLVLLYVMFDFFLIESIRSTGRSQTKTHRTVFFTTIHSLCFKSNTLKRDLSLIF